MTQQLQNKAQQDPTYCSCVKVGQERCAATTPLIVRTNQPWQSKQQLQSEAEKKQCMAYELMECECKVKPADSGQCQHMLSVMWDCREISLHLTETAV